MKRKGDRKMKITRTTLNQYKAKADTIIKGYCKYSNLPWNEKVDFMEIGSNYGIYGWNYTAYWNPFNKTLIIDGYRNM